MANSNQNRSYTVSSPESYLHNPELVEGNPKSKFSCSELGSYSIDSNRNFYNNNKRELRRLIPNYDDMEGSDLTEDFDPSRALNHSHQDRPLDTFLHWIVLNKGDISGSTGGSGGSGQAMRKLDAEFVISRGTMKKLLETVFNCNTGDNQQAWKMYATKYNGTIYISSMEKKIKSNVKKPRERLPNCSNRRKEILYMGTKLEKLISVPCEANGRPADLREVDGRKGFYSVRTGKFAGRHIVLTKAQIDFIENDQYVECKLCLKYTGGDEWKFPMYKLRDWWYHVYAGDMGKVVYGIRDGKELKKVLEIEQREIPSQVQNPAISWNKENKKELKRWNPRACIGFVDEFLQWLKEVVEDSYGMDGGRPVQYALEWKGSSSIAFSREEAHAPNFVLLPPWYIEEMSRFFA